MARANNDAYFTDERLAMTLLDRLPYYGYSVSLGNVIEPAAGSGLIASVLAKQARLLLTNDIANNIEPAVYDRPLDFQLDASKESSWVEFVDVIRDDSVYPSFDWAITNPPYKGRILMPLLDNALVFSNRVAVLLRLSFLEPTAKVNPRAEFWDRYADCLRAIMPIGGPRPSFTPDGKTDSVTTAWFLFDNSWSWSSENIPCPFDFISGWASHPEPTTRKKRKLLSDWSM